MALNPAAVQFIADYWENIAAVVAHVFRVRGHHFKPEYTETYNRTWSSTVISVPSNVNMPTWEEIATIGLHCFGVKALHSIRERAAAMGRLARGLDVRRDAACAGSAPIRTCASALRDMEKTKWWTFFYRKFQVQIDRILADAERLRLAGTNAHINARLYDWGSHFMGASDVDVAVVAPYVMGWIDTLDRSEPISRQSAITKRAQGGSAIRATFATVLVNEQRGDRSYAAVSNYFE